MKIVSCIILVSLVLAMTAGCALKPPLKTADWERLPVEERKALFEEVLKEPDRPDYFATPFVASAGAFSAGLIISLTTKSKSENSWISWMTFSGVAGSVWTGIGFMRQQDILEQRKRVARREIAIIEHPRWRGDRVRAVRAGKIDIDFHKEMVEAAWGKPSLRVKGVILKGKPVEEWTFFFKGGAKVYIAENNYVTAIQTRDMVYYKNSYERKLAGDKLVGKR